MSEEKKKTAIRGHREAVAILTAANFGVTDGVIESLPASAKEDESVAKVAEMIADKVGAKAAKAEASDGKKGDKA